MSNHQDVAISLQNVGVYYRRQGSLLHRGEPFWALKDVSFNLYHGEALGIIGRNGAGKSTMLRLMAGIIRPDRGRLSNYGYGASLLSLQVGFVSYLTGRKNAILSGLLLGLTYEQIEEKMLSIIEFAELGEFIDQPINSYSSGMKARLGFSVAFHVDPDILLIDEVLGVGDAEFQRKSTEVMKAKIRSNKTVVMVSHQASVIRELCNRAVWIHDGVTRAEGDTEDVIKEYEAYLKILSQK